MSLPTVQLKTKLTAADFYKIVFQNCPISVAEDSLLAMQESYHFLKDFSKDKTIYGINTGFGPMAQYKIEDEEKIALQYNLIRSHACGSGNILGSKDVKSLLLARLKSLSLGKSGVPKELVVLLQKLINKNITPLIYEHGGVGASGDLVQLAHLALVLIGEGEVFFKGKRKSTAVVFKEENLCALKISSREGLALINGTSAMAGIGLVNIINARRIVNWSVFCSSALNEMVAAFSDHFSEALNAAKRHKGQQQIAKKMRVHLRDSHRIRQREQDFYKPQAQSHFKVKVQEYYSLRCVPQILGPVWDSLKYSEAILLDEINSASDNPIISSEHKEVYHGGNFHGDYVALEMDKLKLGITKVSMLAERQLNFLMNPKLNDILPPFVNLGKLGFNFGLQGAQFTAVSTTAENQTLSNPMYIHSIPNNNDNQDIVSMGTNAALLTKTVIENTFQVLAVEVLALVQALQCLNENEEFSSKTREHLEKLSAWLPEAKNDVPLYSVLEKIKKYLQENDAYLKRD